MTQQQEKLNKWVMAIPDVETQTFVSAMLARAPAYFWSAPSSSSGQYHPDDEHKFGGLVKHTIRVCEVGKILAESRPGADMSLVLAACILHDLYRYGVADERSAHSDEGHPALAAKAINDYGMFFHSSCHYNAIAGAVARHMGRWGGCLPFSTEEWIVHYADNIAAKYFVKVYKK